MVEKTIDNKLDNKEEKDVRELGVDEGLFEKLMDASGAAVGASSVIKAVVSGASYGSVGLAYLIPYGIFKGIKYMYNAIMKSEEMLSLDGIRYMAKDGLGKILPSGERKLPALVGAVAGSYGLASSYI